MNHQATNNPAEAGYLPGFADVRAAALRIAPYVRRTPLLHSEELSHQLGVRCYFKCENFQYMGAFKARGACNAVFALDAAAAARGVLTHSSGNHGAALARAAQLRGIPSYVVMPRNVAALKRANVAAYGAEIVECEATLAAREQTAAALQARTGGCFVHPYDDPLVIAGQGTAMLELESAAFVPGAVLTPVGGGGLLSGTALVTRRLWPQARMLAAEPAGADDAARSFASGARQGVKAPQTMADGLRGELSERTFELVRTSVDDIVTVTEAGIVAAMRLVWNRLKILIEPSSAVPVAALLERRFAALPGPVVIVLSGGNVDLETLPFAAQPGV
ncbi:MAG: pyridoxal-phosphate dependent enzyme [Steroidobacteraceae bacterium]